MNLNNLKEGEKAIILFIKGDGKLKKRLLALGCIEGTNITFKRSSPFGDPIIVNFRGFDLAIRRKDAKNIIIQIVEE